MPLVQQLIIALIGVAAFLVVVCFRYAGVIEHLGNRVESLTSRVQHLERDFSNMQNMLLRHERMANTTGVNIGRSFRVPPLMPDERY